MSSKNRNFGGSVENVSSKRPVSANTKKTSSVDGNKSSARSTASMASDLTDFLSVTGTTKITKKPGQHKRSGSAGLSRVQNEISGSDSDSVRTSGSSGTKRKIPDLKKNGSTRLSEDHIPQIMSQAKARTKPRLATTFQSNSNSVKTTSSTLPIRLPTESQYSLQPVEVDDWWLTVGDPAPVPPLLLNSPTDLDKKQHWWPGSNKDIDHLKEDVLVNNKSWNVQIGTDNNSLPKSNPADFHGRKDIPSLFLDELLEDEVEVKQRKAAAVNIQRWFRGFRARKKLKGHSAIKQLLTEKKNEKEKQTMENHINLTDEELKDQREEEKRKRREEKARLARQAAIEELQKKREQKRQDNQRKAEEELMFLQSSGKVSKKTSSSKPKAKGKKGSCVGAPSTSAATAELPANNAAVAETASRPATASSVGRKVDEIFQQSRDTAKGSSSAAVETTGPHSDRTDNTQKTLTSTRDGDGSKTTFDDLLESLKQFEDEPTDLLQAEGNTEGNFGGWVRDFVSDDKEPNKPYLSFVSLDHLSKEKLESQGQSGPALSAEKLQSILTFLDEVEKAEDDAISEISQVRDGAISRGLPSSSTSASVAVDREKENAALESAAAAASDVTTAMMAVKIELEEKKRTNDLLQRALNQQREFTLRQAKEMEKDAKQRLAIQRQEYEAAIQRHLSFIDQLIDDKKALGERCEEVVKKLKTTDKKYSDKIKQMEDNHQVELKKQKEVILAAEKIRREKWINEKTQQIKEVTVKGLEPDIQKLIAKHKAEMKKLKSTHQAELLEADERAGRRYIQQIEELRDQLERQKETACARERDLAQQRYEKQLEQEEQAYQQQRRRLFAEVQEEKERQALQAHKQRQELDETRAALEDSHKKSLLDMQNSHQRASEDMERKHQLEMNELKERLEIEKQAWLENYMKKQDAMLLAKERELKEAVREGRDREIDMVIGRLEEETSLAREECERAAENRIKRVRDKYESELNELEESERRMQDKYNGMKARLSEVEGENARLKSWLKQKEEEVEDIDKVTKRLQEERGKVADIIRQEFADRLVTTEEDNKRLKTELSEAKARHRLEVERVAREKEQEMDELHKRVKQAFAKRDDTMKTLREQHQAAMKRSEHLEFLLQEQRKKLLS